MSERYHEDHGNNDSPAPGTFEAGSGSPGVRDRDQPQRLDGGRPARLHRPPGHALVRAVVGSVCWQPLAAVTRTWRSRAGSEAPEASPGPGGSTDDVQASEESVRPLPLRRSGSAHWEPDQVQALPWAGLRFSVGRWRVRLRRARQDWGYAYEDAVAEVYSRPVVHACHAADTPGWLLGVLLMLPFPSGSRWMTRHLAGSLWTTVRLRAVDNCLYIVAISWVQKLRRHLWR